MKRTVIFASYDKKGIIYDYVLSYLRYLKEIANNIIFIADNETLPDEQVKLKDLCCHCEFSRHGEYDFGSYKRGFQYALKSGLLDETDELVFCNDSCFCVKSLAPVFEKMTDVKCDFWGITESKEPNFHLQSYFLVFKKKVFVSSSFEKWIKEIKKQKSSDRVIDIYELGLTSFLEKNGFKSASFIKSSTNINPTSQTSLLLKQGSPLVKKKIFSNLNSTNESRQFLLKILKRNYKESYSFIRTYYYVQGCYLFPLWLPAYSQKVKRFFYQKKISHSGKLCIKICHIPITNKITRTLYNLIKGEKDARC